MMAVILLLLLLGPFGPSWTRVIHEERSLYRNILITEQEGERCMRFVLRARATHYQSCVHLADRRKLVLDYTKMVLAALLVRPRPREVLIVGLGGGTLPMALKDLLPATAILSVEIDPAVVRAAKRFFDYQESERVRTEIMDGRVFVKRAVRQGRRWDIVVLDASNGDYIPEHLMTREFLQEVSDVLAPGGLVVANTFSRNRLYHHESVTYEAVFPHLHVLHSARGNRVIFASRSAFAFPGVDAARADWQGKLRPYGIDLGWLLAQRHQRDWDRAARVLTDQYSPANLLNH
jgi:spermidine synthase